MGSTEVEGNFPANSGLCYLHHLKCAPSKLDFKDHLQKYKNLQNVCFSLRRNTLQIRSSFSWILSV